MTAPPAPQRGNPWERRRPRRLAACRATFPSSVRTGHSRRRRRQSHRTIRRLWKATLHVNHSVGCIGPTNQTILSMDFEHALPPPPGDPSRKRGEYASYWYTSGDQALVQSNRADYTGCEWRGGVEWCRRRRAGCPAHRLAVRLVAAAFSAGRRLWYNGEPKTCIIHNICLSAVRAAAGPRTHKRHNVFVAFVGLLHLREAGRFIFGSLGEADRLPRRKHGPISTQVDYRLHLGHR